MSFGLKNVSATYQRAMVTLFHDMDDMTAKSKKEESHVQILKKLLERLKKYKLRLNPAKCSFGMKSWEVVGIRGE
jgi:hypothetical protein